MSEYLVTGRTLPEAYHNALLALHDHGSLEDCADWGCTQKELSLTMEIQEPLAEPMISKMAIMGPVELQEYVMELLDGIKDFEIEYGNWTYTYHDRIKDQIPFVIEDLKRNPSSRRAVICVRTNADIGSEDPACLQHIQYFIRGGKLHCKILFRSNDASKASFMNMFGLIMLQKRIADALGVEVGTYTHRANSFHCYERDYDMLEGYAKRIRENDLEDITYEYDAEDGWKEEMDEAIPDILARAEALKRH